VVGDEHVDGAEGVLHLVDQMIGRVGVGEVGLEGRCAAERAGELLRGPGARGVVQRHGRTGAGQALGDPSADPTAGTRDECDTSLEVRHGCVAHCMMSNARAPRGPASYRCISSPAKPA
jgi:hypothetical protein